MEQLQCRCKAAVVGCLNDCLSCEDSLHLWIQHFWSKKKCSQLRSISDEKIALVHAFADGPYDRSSFHLAGRPHHVATVATMIAEGAINGLLLLRQDRTVDEESRHPFVGLVDHIAVMPLVYEVGDCTGTTHHRQGITPNGQAAEYIGKQLMKTGLQVHFYGNANPDGTPLADVRRDQTNFFRSGGLESTTEASSGETNPIGVATIGAPSTFVENFNIRLTPNCTRTMARSLTRALRERDGGLVGVEGLTLPYSNHRYEIACNMLQPEVGSAEAMMDVVQTWALQQLQSSSCFTSVDELVEVGYRVGTTAEQCLQVLSLSEEELKVHDSEVCTRLKGFLGLL